MLYDIQPVLLIKVFIYPDGVSGDKPLQEKKSIELSFLLLKQVIHG
jgi:hypothetical protein